MVQVIIFGITKNSKEQEQNFTVHVGQPQRGMPILVPTSSNMKISLLHIDRH